MAQLVKPLAIDFGSGHDLMVCEVKPHVGLYADSVEPVWDSLSPSPLCPTPACTGARVCALSLKINK